MNVPRRPGLTIFTIPKPFRDHVGVIQRNALRSWIRLRGVEVLLLGDEDGVDGVASAEGVRHVKGCRTNEFGTPLLDHAFALAYETSKTRLLCYANADIIFLSDLVNFLGVLPSRPFLVMGQRWNLEIDQVLPMDSLTIESWLRQLVATAGAIHPPSGSDYFIFPKDVDWGMPPFAVGRPGWDNWLIYRARRMRIPVVDASASIRPIHQNHTHEHVTGRTSANEGPETARHLGLIGGHEHVFTLADATHVLTSRGVRRRIDRGMLLRFLRRMGVLYPALQPLAKTLSRLKAAVARR